MRFAEKFFRTRKPFRRRLFGLILPIPNTPHIRFPAFIRRKTTPAFRGHVLGDVVEIRAVFFEFIVLRPPAFEFAQLARNVLRIFRETDNANATETPR